MQTTVPWIIALVACLGLLALTLVWVWRRSGDGGKQLPTEWSLTARPVFSTDERRVYRLLKEALPHHVILSKLPLVRFCQPTEAKEVRYWFELLGSVNVTFAICSPNGRVLAAVDLDSERSVSGRSLQIKQAVLGACRVRYLRCPIDNLPSPAELQLLVPFSSSARGPLPAPTPSAIPSRPHNSVPPQRRSNLWQDSAMFGDSFFTPDSRYDSATGGRSLAREGAEALHTHRPLPRGGFSDTMGMDSQYPEEASNDIVGVVVDTPRYGMR